MRVLFITSRFPGNLRRGDELRAYQHLRCLSARHAITLLAFEHGIPDAARLAEMETCCERVIVVKKNLGGMLIRAGGALFGRIPLQAAMNDSSARCAGLKELIHSSPFDVAHLQLARLGPVLKHLEGVPCVLDLIDALSANMQRRAEFDHGITRFLARMEARRLAPYERYLCAQVAAATVSSARDREAIGNDLSQLHVVDNGVDLAEFPFGRPRAGTTDVVFVGNLGYFPNIDAATWFAQDVMPSLMPRVPSAIFNIVGARPAASLHRLARMSSNVRLVGSVDHVQPQLARAAVAVAPMRAGSGQQIKILEAMACGIPVVATPMAAAGLDAIPDRHFLVAEGAKPFADAVALLLTDRSLADTLAQNARELIEQRFTWIHSAQAMERHWFAVAKIQPGSL